MMHSTLPVSSVPDRWSPAAALRPNPHPPLHTACSTSRARDRADPTRFRSHKPRASCRVALRDARRRTTCNSLPPLPGQRTVSFDDGLMGDGLISESFDDGRTSEAPSSSTSDSAQISQAPKALLVGRVQLLIVAALWGSYSPVVSLLLAQDGHPSFAFLVFFKGLMGTATFALPILSSGPAASEPRDPNPFDLPIPWGGRSKDPTRLIVASLELGVYYGMAQLLVTYGLTQTSALHAAFLIGLKSLLVPLISGTQGEEITGRTWTGGAMAILAVLVSNGAITGRLTDLADFTRGFQAGDLWVAAGVLLFATGTVRTGVNLREGVDKNELALGRSLSKTLVALAFLSYSLWQATVGFDCLWPAAWPPSPYQLLLVAFLCLGPEALATWLQSQGQALVPPSQAQILYSTTPLWGAALALGVQGTGIDSAQIAGGLLLLSAIYVSTPEPHKPPNPE